MTLSLGAVLGPAQAGEQRRTIGLVAVCAYVALVVVNSAWLWPILSGQLITYAGVAVADLVPELDLTGCRVASC